MSKFMNWVADHITFSDIIDSYFIETDLKDVHITEHERAETAYYDAKCQHQAGQQHGHYDCPEGKQVW